MTKTGLFKQTLLQKVTEKSSRLFLIAAVFCAAIGAVCLLLNVLIRQNSSQLANKRISLDLATIPQTIIEADTEMSVKRDANCSLWDCFNMYKCGTREQYKMAIYVYPLQTYVDTAGTSAFKLSKEFYTLLKTIVDSPYYTPNPDEACILIPSIDTLNENRISNTLVAQSLSTLAHWAGGENHMLFNMIPGEPPDFETVLNIHSGRAMIAAAGFDTWTYRSGFDMSIPYWDPSIADYTFPKDMDKIHFFVSSQLNMLPRHTRVLQELTYDNPDMLLLQRCPAQKNAASSTVRQEPLQDWRCQFAGNKPILYPRELSSGVFCLVARGARLIQINLLASMAAGCIPVIMADNIVMPFSEIIDWSLASITIREADLYSVITLLRSVSVQKVGELQQQIKYIYERYFKSLDLIVMTMLDHLNDRIFPHLAKDYRYWNLPAAPNSVQNPLFLPLTAPKSQGFTAVILTYDRVESLFTLINKLSAVNSLQKILVIWNNQKKSPPHPAIFPKISKPLKVIRTTSNKLSNRFYPYEEIETEAILTIDDDINMLTADELDFGYDVWREFPDRIVGFPSRTHVWDNVTMRWRYESEWTNQISMVLTGAAFHHKFWSYMYTNAMPGDIKQWVDDHMNCEDIAMNFLVANTTRKPPIKVAPRKKFKCPECTNTEMLSADLNHMLERSACIDRFAGIYGTMPLKTVEFRVDPVLFKDNFPEKLKRYNDIGSL